MELIKKGKNFLNRLNSDESAPTTVEWILLVVVILLILGGIYMIINWASKDTGKNASVLNTQKSAMESNIDSLKNALGV